MNLNIHPPQRQKTSAHPAAGFTNGLGTCRKPPALPRQKNAESIGFADIDHAQYHRINGFASGHQENKENDCGSLCRTPTATPANESTGMTTI